MWIDCRIAPLLLSRATTRPAVVLTGARLTGKTSLARRRFPDHACVTLDLPSEAEQAEHDPEPLAGAMWEMLVCADLRPSQTSWRGGWDLQFWRNRSRGAGFFLHWAGAFHLADAMWTGRLSARGPAVDWRGFLPGPDDDQE